MRKTEITISPRSLTLSRNALKRLCEIAGKATEGDPDAESVFILSAKEASVSSHSIEDLMNTKWPKDIGTVRLLASSHKNNKWVAMNFDNSRPNYNRITVSGFDSDWVAARAGEIEAFISVHRNMHWIFHGKLLASLHGLLLVGLPLFRAAKAITDRWSLTSAEMVLLTFIVTSCGWLILLAYVLYIGRVFPFVYVESERSSHLVRIKKVLTVAIPLIIIGLIVDLTIRPLLILPLP
jgi:hypothetical protein